MATRTVAAAVAALIVTTAPALAQTAGAVGGHQGLGQTDRTIVGEVLLGSPATAGIGVALTSFDQFAGHTTSIATEDPAMVGIDTGISLANYPIPSGDPAMDAINLSITQTAMDAHAGTFGATSASASNPTPSDVLSTWGRRTALKHRLVKTGATATPESASLPVPPIPPAAMDAVHSAPTITLGKKD
jgi:hypothetical protein